MYPNTKKTKSLTSTLAKTVLGAAIAATFTLSACKKDEAKTDETPTAVEPATEPTTEATPKVETETPAASEDQSFAAGMMKSYEECRVLLATDKTEGIADCAKAMYLASQAAKAMAPEAAREAMSSLETSAEALASASEDGDIETVRLRFGELSKWTVAMLTAAPKAGKNYHVFECPMAKGYKRWAQPGATLENPYMGAKMLSCGSETHDHHAGMKEEGEGAGEGGGDGAGSHEHGDHGHKH